MESIIEPKRQEMMRYRALSSLAVLAALFLTSDAFAQRLSLGFVGGTNLTHDFSTAYQTPPGAPVTSVLFSDSRSLILGLTMEVDLTKELSIEIDALHRNLRLEGGYITASGQRVSGGDDLGEIGTWEFPFFLKYKIPVSKIRPFIEAGPSFRVRKNPNSTKPSASGFAAGIGAELRVGRFRLAPELRYTRWADEPPFPQAVANTKSDQVELLTAISYATSPESWHIFGGKFHAGPVAGVVFLKALAPELRAGQPLSESQGYVAGLMTEVDFTRRFSLEVDGLYRPIRAQLVNEASPFSIVTWQIPVLAKFKLPPAHPFQPFVEAGPSFRLSGNLNGYYPSHFGFTASAGIETHWRAIRIAPAVRYTRWATDGTLREFRTLPNQIEILAGFSF